MRRPDKGRKEERKGGREGEGGEGGSPRLSWSIG